MTDKEKYRAMFCDPNWDYETLQAADEVISRIGKEYLKLKIYPNQIEVVTSEQMLDAYALTGLPTSYPHWKFGKDFVLNQSNYSKGRMGLSYELVINSNPCISYNMENNSTCMMLLVIAHACQGHNAFFANNYMFLDWTSADSIVDYMAFAREYVLRCEEEHGEEEVEKVLDAAHALMNYGVDKYRKPSKLSALEENERLKKLTLIRHENYNELWRTLPKSTAELDTGTLDEGRFPKEPEDNILYFIEKYAPALPAWKRELVRIVRKVSQYFYPQGATKVMNEGFATFVHYHIINKMFEEGFLNDGFMLEFIKSHSGVLYQPEYNSKFYSGLNPYTLGFNIFMDIKRICQEPTEEDKAWFPDLIGKDWLDQVLYVMENFRDDSFIMQYLSPKVIRDMKLFTIIDNEGETEFEIGAIHNERGYRRVREQLAAQYDRSSHIPNIQVTRVDRHQTSKLYLTHYMQRDRKLETKSARQTMAHLRYLWGFPVELHSKNKLGINESSFEIK
ncbi:SpoVR family protein [Pontibacter sp. HSC-36F09]|uniref:SpoVR family protein n=1 Tax=Pontibacter sp. HSC-36F09 TaxID=2910966 RepID=UPI00209EE016|nr:SpoVR family protein [Pontibacter sp. HSC-36F09]MCP2045143.1 spore cortex formation protein SpoVR/YcgB (stage V sporulation) [Pontibacter sp. HSC-36F09]